jgi:O-antigen/teichoic acid export membrane protein
MLPKSLEEESVALQAVIEPLLTPYLPVLAEDVPLQPQGDGVASRFTRNSAMSVGRLILSTFIALILPAYLTHKLPVKTFSAWVLILQMSAYVGYLDFGVQTAISKYVAEYQARKDMAGANMRASAGLAIMIAASIVGVMLTLVLAWRVPSLFNEMPPVLYRDVRISMMLVGISLSFGLVCSVTSAIFLGLQRYGVPTILTLINRILFTVAVMVAVALHSSLAVMGAVVAGVNVITGVAQIVAWRRLASHIQLSLRNLDGAVVKQMLSYCSVIAIWLIGMLCVSGLDVTIVGRYDFPRTAFYSIAILPTNFLLAIMGAALAPLLPEASARNVVSNPAAMGQMLSRITRYAVLLLCLTGVPLLLGGYYALRLWVGEDYAIHTVGLLRLLILANMIRNICLPYATMLVATERQKTAIAGAVVEAVVNLASSIYLAHRIGALGVAIGTLLGSFFSVGMHFAVSMNYTQRNFSVTRAKLFVSGVLRPATVIIPSLLCVRLWWTASAPALGPATWLGWAVGTLFLAWFAGLDASERSRLLGLARTRAGLRSRQTPAH